MSDEEKACCCHCRTKHRDDKEERDLLNRLSRIEGQIRNIAVAGVVMLVVSCIPVKAFQKAKSLTADGICGCNTWRRLAGAAVGIGKTQTVIN